MKAARFIVQSAVDTLLDSQMLCQWRGLQVRCYKTGTLDKMWQLRFTLNYFKVSNIRNPSRLTQYQILT